MMAMWLEAVILILLLALGAKFDAASLQIRKQAVSVAKTPIFPRHWLVATARTLRRIAIYNAP